MKIYLFRPSNCWNYCGGGLAIIAESFEDAQKMFSDKLHLTDEDAEKDEENSWDNWTLVESFDLNGKQEPRIVFKDYNWA